MDKKYILDKLSQIDKNKYGIFEIGLFGSYAKDNADDNNDIDVLVKLEFKKGMYQNFCELQKELEKIFNRKVDLIEKGTFDYKFKNNNVREYKKKIKEEILGSVIYV
ncbi:nucleotidyltransferase domain-containing protein [Fusobacterium animalis]|uniref:nucleotidyltransferase domain-containing protein n=1 Tax=Fusobacterium animalis TaxID=76859 RepID=UPI0034DE8D37